jgi:hypothetical protein
MALQTLCAVTIVKYALAQAEPTASCGAQGRPNPASNSTAAQVNEPVGFRW